MTWVQQSPCTRKLCRAVHLVAALAAPTLLFAQYDIRLVDGPSSYVGRLEVFASGSWLAVCKRGFDSVDASVACRQLGSQSGVVSSTSYGMLLAGYWLSDLECTGQERTLFECNDPDGVGFDTCGIFQEVSIACEDPGEGAVRLLSTLPSPAEKPGYISGRLEVYHDGSWGHVCSTAFGRSEADVVCRQLDLGAGRVSAQNHGADIAIAASRVTCTGDEANLLACDIDWTGSAASCSSVGVYCANIRLMGAEPGLGRLELLIGNQFSRVSFDSYHVEAATTACQELGWTYMAWMEELSSDGSEVTVTCWNVEDQLSNCMVNYYSSGGPVTLTCDTQDTYVTYGELRLVGDDAHIGRLEVWMDGSWGTICSTGFDDGDASVACRQMGHDSGVFRPDKSLPGDAWQDIKMGNVACGSGEALLVDCSYTTAGWGCSHNEDVSVECLSYAGGYGSLRIADGGNRGRLEVLMDEWGTVCDDSFTNVEATVACRQMGWEMGGTFFTYSGTSSTADILMDDVVCNGHEARLIDCNRRSSGHNCGHSEDVGVECEGDREGGVRMGTDGVLETYYGGSWGTVCSTGFDQNAARVVCRELGLSGGEYHEWGWRTPIALEEVYCAGSEWLLLECPHTAGGYCASGLVVAVECTRTRLVGTDTSTDSLSGRLEVYAGGSWGTVCDDRFDDEDAVVACRSMGYTGGYVDHNVAPYTGYGMIHMDEVYCLGTEASLFDCSYDSHHDCSHPEDVGIVCGASTGSEEAVEISLPGWIFSAALILPAICVLAVCWRRVRAALVGRVVVAPAPIAPAPAPQGTVIGAVPKPGQLAKISIKVPRDGVPGSKIRVKTPHGCTIECTIPDNFQPGMVFEAQYPIPDDYMQLVDEDGLGVGALCTAVAIPKYWTNGRNAINEWNSNESNQVGEAHEAQATPAFDQMVYVGLEQHDKFNKLMRSSYVPRATQDRACPTGACARRPGGCPCVQPDGKPGLPTEYCVRRVVRVEDSEMWSRYEVKRDQIKASRREDAIDRLDPPAVTDEMADKYDDVFEPLDGNLNEVYLWHGTAVRTALSIAQEDFRIDLAGTGRGTMYGPGAYMAESSTKADEYARDEKGGYYDGIYALLLCRVCLGKFFYTTERDEEAVERVKRGRFDSTVGDRVKSAGTFREFVVYNADQLYPEYIVMYSRIHRGDSPAKVEALFSGMDFHMELPVYWANCHKDPKEMAFHQQYKVRVNTLAILQRLVQASYKGRGKVKILKARRVENSTIWNSYQAFKQKVRRACKQKKRSVEHSFRPVEELVGDPEAGGVLTMNHLQGESLEECISISNVELALNELLLWHGTDKDSAENIVRNDFLIPKGSHAKHGGRYGTGAYFAEDMAKSLQYATSERGTKTVLLCRVCCGDIYYTESAVEQEALANAAKADRHSVLANPANAEWVEAKFRSREFIVPDAQQVYPEYILELQES